MNVESRSHDPVVTAVLHDPAADVTHVREEQPHNHATEVAHAWEHFHENARFFAGFFAVILLTFVAFNINFGSWNTPVILVLAALRSGLIALFLANLFKSFSFVFKTLTFTAIFLAFMIGLSLWDSQLRGIGNPIRDSAADTSQSHVP
jgi:hypothetical protein